MGQLAQALFIIGLILLIVHALVLAVVVLGHVRMGLRKRPIHLLYVLPLTWYFISLLTWFVSACVYPDIAREDWWPLGRHPDEEAAILTVLCATVLIAAHGCLLGRLLRPPGRPPVSGMAILSLALAVPFYTAPLGLALATGAVWRVRASNGRLRGRPAAWGSLLLNGVLTAGVAVFFALTPLDDIFCLPSSPSPTVAAAPAPPVVTPPSPPAPEAPPEPPAAAPVLTVTSPPPSASLETPSSPSVSDSPGAIAAEAASFEGDWRAAFHFERNTRNPAEPPHPWFEFRVTLQPQGSWLIGPMKGLNVNIGGVISGQVHDADFIGSMRLGWDTHDWERVTLTRDPGNRTATGEAIFRANPSEQHVYRLRLSRP